MNVGKLKKRFDEKGYCEVEIRTNAIDKADVVIGYGDGIKELIQILENFKEIMLDYQDTTLNNYLILYDNSKVDIVIIDKLSEFVEVIANEKSNFKDIDHIFFRGHSRTNYKLEPSLYRKDNKNVLNNEDNIFRDLLSSKPHFFEDCTTTLEKLVKMQHHGIPTRLLDLSDNPLIVLYFACISNSDNNGEVLVFNIDDGKFKYFDSDTVAVITNLVKCPNDFDITEFEYPYSKGDQYEVGEFGDDEKDKKARTAFLDKKKSEFNSRDQISELIHYIREDKPYFLNRIEPNHLCDYTIVVKAKMTIDRMVSQSGAFILFGINRNKMNSSNNNINKADYKQKVIIIPAEYKSKIKNELKMFNINDATVFGDLDTTAKYFTNKYK